ncbi:hypothetical protein [Providencia rettgeri]|uniref:hypothetical protein n=1 Tax=Providencia rettgeri TaxID=587 RepID=UPI0032DADBCE
MFKKIFSIWDSYAVFILPIMGFTLLLSGQIMLSFQVFERVASILSNTGIALLGGALFTAITKTSHYTRFFQDRIYDVFYSPEKSVTADLLINKWKTLTHFLLRRTAGDLHEDVAAEILKRYFNSDIQYYFEEVVETYDIVLASDNRTATIKKKVTNRIVINDNRADANLIQRITSRAGNQLKAVYIDNVEIDISSCVKEEDIIKQGEDHKFSTITINIKNDRKPKFIERYYVKEQDIILDPWTIVNNSKFIQQLTVKYKAINCKIRIVETGSISNPDKEIKEYLDKDGYTRVIISPIDGLTLPGEGYILLITPLHEKEEEEHVKI